MPKQNLTDDLDIVGQEITFSEKARGASNGVWMNIEQKEMPLGPDVFYPAILVSIEPGVHPQYGNQFIFQFELQGKDYSFQTKEGEIKQFRVKKITSRIMSPKSSLYKIYSKLVGELKEGDIVGKTVPGLKELIGMPVNVMLEGKKYQDKEGNSRISYKVEKLSKREVISQIQQPQTTTVQQVTTQIQPQIKKEEPKVVPVTVTPVQNVFESNNTDDVANLLNDIN